MIESEILQLICEIQSQKCETQTREVKSAKKGCPEKLYDTLSSFSNQDDGGVIVFGLDEKDAFNKVGVYDAQDLQKKIMEICEEMTPVVRPRLSVCEENGLLFVTAEIPPVELADRPCFKTAKGRLKGSYVRVGDGDKPMTEYEVYSYEAYRRRIRDDIRPVDDADLSALDRTLTDQYLLKRKQDRPNFASVTQKQLMELTGIVKAGKLTLSALLMFSPYPQMYFPQLSIIAARVPGTEMGQTDDYGQRFSDSRRIEGNLPEMLEAAVTFMRTNMRTEVRIDPKTGVRTDVPEYPADALREAVLNALLHRDYSRYTENMPVQIIMFSDRIEIRNPGGLYGRLTVDQLGKMQPDTRNPFLITAMEAIGKTENRYSGILRIRQAMRDLDLPEPVFESSHGEFAVILKNRNGTEKRTEPTEEAAQDPHNNGKKDVLAFCITPKTRKEIAAYLGIESVQYAMKRYIEPLIENGQILLSIPEKPKSSSQTYRTNTGEGISRHHTAR